LGEMEELLALPQRVVGIDADHGDSRSGTLRHGAGVAAVDNTGKTHFGGYMALPDNISRAGSLHLVAGHIALNFANTASGRGSPTHEEHLRVPLNVVEWAGHADLLSAEDAKRLKRRKLPAKLLTEATKVRDLVHEIGEGFARQRTADPKHLADLSRRYAHVLKAGRLMPAKTGCAWGWPHLPEAILGPIMQAAVELLTTGDPARIKQCQGHECGWLFYDETKNNNRRWCDMKVCGNRAKARAARKRRKAGR
jgi:predicted RNA-binding Zn ribbon-like protein